MNIKKTLAMGVLAGITALSPLKAADISEKGLKELVQDYKIQNVTENTQILMHIPQTHLPSEGLDTLETMVQRLIKIGASGFKNTTENTLKKVIKSQKNVYHSLDILKDNYDISEVLLEGFTDKIAKNFENKTQLRALKYENTLPLVKYAGLTSKIEQSLLLRSICTIAINRINGYEEKPISNPKNIQQQKANQIYEGIQQKSREIVPKNIEELLKDPENKNYILERLSEFRTELDEKMNNIIYASSGGTLFCLDNPEMEMKGLENEEIIKKAIEIKNINSSDKDRKKYMLEDREDYILKLVSDSEYKLTVIVLGARHNFKNNIKKYNSKHGTDIRYIKINPNSMPE